ncbi:MAG: DsrE family protein [Aquificaceae bacterium]|nr:DsrE family protein [Aquificaceae bacterium]MDW8423899.1 DsrE family protein [Aquificaceae bacterium]
MDRRSFFRMFPFLASLPLVNRVASATPSRMEMSQIRKEAEIGVVYHCDFPQEDRFRTMLRNIGNHLSVYDYNPMKIKIVVVAHGAGVKFFMKDLSGSPWEKETIKIQELYEEERSLITYGVDFYICNITLQRLKLEPTKLHEFTKIVPSGVGVIGHLQAVERFAYIKVV